MKQAQKLTQTGKIQRVCKRLSTSLQARGMSCNLLCMSSKAQAVIEQFNSLPQIEQLAVYEAIARKVTPAN
jgi:hypothetical protein